MGRGDPPEAFDFDAYLDFLQRHGHNFIRLWAWDSVRWDTRSNAHLGKPFIHNVAPLPWARTGPGLALDGKPKFDLTRFEPAYFERLRARATAAGRRGIYLSVMLFEGWGLMHGNRRKGAEDAWAWRGHPFHPENNVNGINGSKEGEPLGGAVHSVAHPEVSALQAAYVRKVVDTVNDLDNVLYEVINEGGQKEWDCLVLLPSVAKPNLEDAERAAEATARYVVEAQDIPWLQRAPGDKTPAPELLARWMREQAGLTGQ